MVGTYVRSLVGYDVILRALLSVSIALSSCPLALMAFGSLLVAFDMSDPDQQRDQ